MNGKGAERIKECMFGALYAVLDNTGRVATRDGITAAWAVARRHAARTKRKTWLVQVIAKLEVKDGGDGEEKTNNGA